MTTMMYIRALALLSVGALSLSSCADDTSGIADVPEAVAAPVAHLVPPTGDDEFDTDTFIRYDQQAAYVVYRDRADDWLTVHDRVRAFLADVPAADMAYAVQAVAPKILREHLLVGAATEAKGEATSWYVDLLIENQAPAADLVLDAVEVYEGTWPEPYTRRVSTEASAVTLAYVDARADCEGCGTLPASAPHPGVQMDRDEQLRASAVRLQQR